ncbi:helix-turn-helix domain-containing protein [Nocardiopsis sp. CT-R113]|uniref:Helix-turn-helix domain-containing protein n=1 Tax=Nocardiopsis codii TaxID=3065942 RepID=A0ABU7KFJ0_9ACTN|nr:helix-turn-helix domain-containing protein [Nocardiopsis sp. CT-R113]MEE2041016.1 helix-turn-helix domain-containing protein [Nocardiopsis sp. CT-R113]
MIRSEFNTDDLPAEDRFDIWRHHVVRAPTPMDATSDRIVDFHVSQRDLHLDAARVWMMGLRALTLHRTPHLIKRSDPEAYNICLIRSGSLDRGWGGQEATYGPYDIHVNDSSRPFDLQAPGGKGLVMSVGVDIPKRMLSLPQRQADRMDGLRLSGREGIGALLGVFLTQLTENPRAYTASDGPRLALPLGDLVSALFAHTLEAEKTLVPESRTRSLLLRIRAFVHEHLHEPHLTPSTIAAAHHISVSYLHRLFQQDDITVSAWIRQQRLERTRRNLADPTLSEVPIHLIAARWGFSHPAAFSRAFRAAYGIAPRDYRHRFHGSEGRIE